MNFFYVATFFRIFFLGFSGVSNAFLGASQISFHTFVNQEEGQIEGEVRVMLLIPENSAFLTDQNFLLGRPPTGSIFKRSTRLFPALLVRSGWIEVKNIDRVRGRGESRVFFNYSIP